jgi:hypothetical protein
MVRNALTIIVHFVTNMIGYIIVSLSSLGRYYSSVAISALIPLNSMALTNAIFCGIWEF